MPKYSPLINTVVSVRLPEIEADSSDEAARKVLANFDGHAILNYIKPGPGQSFIHMQWNEKNETILIDEVGDEEGETSSWYDYDGDPI